MSDATPEFPFQLALKNGRLEYNDKEFRHVRGSKSYARILVLNILWVEVETREKNKLAVINALANQNGKLKLTELALELKGNDRVNAGEAERFLAALMEKAYNGVKREKRLRVLVNPVGGKGNASRIYEREVKEILEAAHCEVDMTISERHGHMIELCQNIGLNCDAVVVLSGDGGVHEVINGLAKHSEPHKALRIPIAQVPTGSANALCVNHFGPKHAFDVPMALLNVIKGKPMKASVYSITQGDTHYLSFLTQAAGLMADLDLGTEHLRWMGDSRFILGYLQGVVTKKTHPFEIEYKLVNDDKHDMLTAARKRQGDAHFYEEEEETEPRPLPWLTKDRELSSEGWTTFDKPIMYLYAGGLPYVARDLMQFPMSNPSDDCIDLVIQAKASRGIMIKATVGAEKGDQFWVDSQHYYKVTAYRFKPTGKGNLTIDGEFYPFEPFEVQVHTNILRFLSLEGKYNTEAFNLNHGLVPSAQRDVSLA